MMMMILKMMIMMAMMVMMISAAYELIINIADLFNFSEDDIYKKELAKQWRLKKALCSLVVPFPHSPSFSGRFHEVEFSSTFPLSNKIYRALLWYLCGWEGGKISNHKVVGFPTSGANQWLVFQIVVENPPMVGEFPTIYLSWPWCSGDCISKNLIPHRMHWKCPKISQLYL